MRTIIAAAALVVLSATSALATPVAVPEIDAFSGMAALGAVGSIAALMWERRRRRTH